MIFLRAPEDFKASFETAGCFCEYKGKILLLQRTAQKPQGGTWGVPAGKRHAKERIETTMIRELYEETKISCNKADFEYLKPFYVRFKEFDFVFHVFRTVFQEFMPITLNPLEHDHYRWFTPQDALALPLIQDLDYCLEYFYIKK